jgi:hypothetical protein
MISSAPCVCVCVHMYVYMYVIQKIITQKIKFYAFLKKMKWHINMCLFVSMLI